MKVRLKDIAEATGFSINTVSHALRDAPDISEATKKQIRRVAEEMEYIPDLRAGSIKSGKSRIISIILPDIINPHFTIVFREIEQFFRQVGVTPFFMNTNESGEEEMNAVRLSIGQKVDGVILCPTQVSDAPVKLLERSGIPFVLIGRRFDASVPSDYVICDDTQGAYLATAHLLALGHRSIAYVKTNDRISSDRERFAGYRRALEEAGVAFDESWILNLSLTGEQNEETIRRFLQEHCECTAILSFNDILAYGIIRQIREMGREVPHDVSVMGFDNICSDYRLPLGLSSVSVSKKTMAKRASELLYEQMQMEAAEREALPPRHIVLPTELYLRETTALCREEEKPS